VGLQRPKARTLAGVKPCMICETLSTLSWCGSAPCQALKVFAVYTLEDSKETINTLRGLR
jgi:hypothetical protein